MDIAIGIADNRTISVHSGPRANTAHGTGRRQRQEWLPFDWRLIGNFQALTKGSFVKGRLQQ